MSTEAGWNKLNYATRTLREHFDGTESEWRDQVRKRFESQYIEPLELQVASTMRAMRQIGEVLRQVRRDCAVHRDE